MKADARYWTVRERMNAIFRGEAPDHMPFIDRLELWYMTHVRAGTMPEMFRDMSLTDIHRKIGIGQQKFVAAYAHRLRGVELTVQFEGETLRREIDPVVEFFPRMDGLAVQDRVGITVIDLRTPLGTLTMRYRMVDAMVRMGTEAYMVEHLVKEDDDCRIVEYIIERAEFISLYENIQRAETALGEIGFVVPAAGRIPFQQILLEYMGDLKTFYALYDRPVQFERFLDVIDRRVVEDLRQLGTMPVLYVEFGDNLHGLMTNPRLFAKYCLPAYQRYAAILHAQGKRMGSHIDGDPQPLLQLIAESGLDVCESFSPAPLTPCPFEAAWKAWHAGPIIWGGIPSPILEETTTEDDFRAFVARILALAGDRPIILGIGDQVLGSSLIERVQYIADRVNALAPCR